MLFPEQDFVANGQTLAQVISEMEVRQYNRGLISVIHTMQLHAGVLPLFEVLEGQQEPTVGPAEAFGELIRPACMLAGLYSRVEFELDQLLLDDDDERKTYLVEFGTIFIAGLFNHNQEDLGQLEGLYLLVVDGEAKWVSLVSGAPLLTDSIWISTVVATRAVSISRLD